MIYISKEDYKAIPKDYKSVFSSDSIHGTKNNGKRTWMTSKNGATVLLIEGKNFEIVDLSPTGNFEKNCDSCYGTGATEHDVSTYQDITPQSEFRECNECNGSGIIEASYEGY